MATQNRAHKPARHRSYQLIQDVEITDFAPIKFHIESLKKTGDADLRLIWRFTLPDCV
ncbi:hypothetical protein [Paraburkholderia sp.]|uniref:hypothetical protein n=1 Tax=Paraburkholderia sp. TaxID=1926495 RepID=UPI0025FD743D|nr:hypothetical protein [Paraburkholderia sp.]